ncbi:MAG: pyruvate, water dikinase regulatory protein [Peptococcaceae bacterium]|nr:pyruvate, water dikinase regulatory protein [Peptococcaceae bacterium]
MTNDIKKIAIYILSDSVGETAQYVARAAANQFPGVEVSYKHIPFVEDADYLAEVLEQIDPENSILMFTLVVEKLRRYVVEYCQSRGIGCVDVLASPFVALENLTGQMPAGHPGLIQRMDESYFKKIEAMEFAIKYDDGKDVTGINTADLVLIGVSRTSKTPLSMYMAYRGIKVANVPLVPEVKVNDRLFEIPKNKIIGLTIQPDALGEIRQERVRGLGVASPTDYTDLGRILDELDYAEGIMKRIGCPVIDVTHKAVEETASVILQIYLGRGENIIG